MLVNKRADGYIDSRLKNLRRAAGNKKKTNVVNDEIEHTDNAVAGETVNFEDELHILKSLIVSEENMPIIVEKLDLTRNFRQELIKKPEADLKTHFPYFFTHPYLVWANDRLLSIYAHLIQYNISFIDIERI